VPPACRSLGPLRVPALTREDVVFVLAAHHIARTHEVEEDAAWGAATAVGEGEPALGLDGEGLPEQSARPLGAEAIHCAGDEADGRG